MDIFSNQYSSKCTSAKFNMFNKIIYAALLVAFTQAIQYDGHQGALSTVSFNNHQNTVHHIQSAPVVAKVAVPIHAAPVHVAPVVHSSPLLQSFSSGHGIVSSHRYTAPITSSVHHVPVVAAPVHAVQAAPAHHASSYSSLSIGHSAAAGPSLHIAPAVQAAPVAHAAPVFHAAPAVHVAPAVHASSHHVEEYAHPKYEFAYGVEDHHTGDIHSHKESRDGDVTHGEYSLHEADGTIRTVKYSVDKHSGFNAIVERSGHATHAQPIPISHHH